MKTLSYFFKARVDDERLLKIGKECIEEYFQELREDYEFSSKTIMFYNFFEYYTDYFYEECVEIATNFQNYDIDAEDFFDKIDNYMKDILLDTFNTIYDKYC